MKKYRYTYPIDQNSFFPLPENGLFLDIETTGFQRKSTFLTILGLAWQEGNTIVIEQWMNECLGAGGFQEERLLLAQFETFLKQHHPLPTLIHYNGTTFDLPYLKSKYEQYDMETSLSNCESRDFYRIAKKYQSFLQADGLKQKDMEEAFGLFRTDTLSGPELIATYQKGIETGNGDLLDLYLLHNKEDMEGMVFLQRLFQVEDFFSGVFEISEWMQHRDSLSISLSSGFSLHHSLSVTQNGISFIREKDQLSITVPIFNIEARYFYPDYKNYYYLPLEDRAIHKSVAFFVEKEYRQKASKETCYIKKSDTFYPLPLPQNKKDRKALLNDFSSFDLFYQSYGDDTAYLPCDILEEDNNRVQYVSHLLWMLLKN
jgi:hypothetical protein